MLGYRALVGMMQPNGRARYIKVERLRDGFDRDPLGTLERWSSGEFGALALLTFGDIESLDGSRLALAPKSDRTASAVPQREAPDADGFCAAARECEAEFAALYARDSWRGWAIPPEGLTETLAASAGEVATEIECVQRAARGFDAANHAPERQARKLRAAARSDAQLALAALHRGANAAGTIKFTRWSELFGTRNAIHLGAAESRGIGIVRAREALARAEDDAVHAAERIRALREQVERSLRGEPLYTWPPATESTGEADVQA